MPVSDDHDDIYVDLRRGGWAVCVQLCGENPLCVHQSGDALSHDGGRHRVYAGHRRQCADGYDTGRGRPGAGQPVFFHDRAVYGDLRHFCHCAGHCISAGYRAAAGRNGGDDGGLSGVRPDFHGIYDAFHAAERVSHLSDHSRKTETGADGYGGCRSDQHGAGCSVCGGL